MNMIWVLCCHYVVAPRVYGALVRRPAKAMVDLREILSCGGLLSMLSSCKEELDIIL